MYATSTSTSTTTIASHCIVLEWDSSIRLRLQQCLSLWLACCTQVCATATATAVPDVRRVSRQKHRVLLMNPLLQLDRERHQLLVGRQEEERHRRHHRAPGACQAVHYCLFSVHTHRYAFASTFAFSLTVHEKQVNCESESKSISRAKILVHTMYVVDSYSK